MQPPTLRHRLFRPGQRIAVAVSGGADSVALLRRLLEERHALGIVLSVAHVHHGIRGAAAEEDAAFVAGTRRSSWPAVPSASRECTGRRGHPS